MRARTVNFERGQDPKSQMDIGVAHIIPKITSEDLELLEFGWDYNKGKFSEEEFLKEYRFKGDSDEFVANQLTWAKKVALALKDKIIYEYKIWDWKNEGEMIVSIKSNPHPEYPFLYDAHPGVDDWQIVWSKVLLPSADEIEV